MASEKLCKNCDSFHPRGMAGRRSAGECRRKSPGIDRSEDAKQHCPIGWRVWPVVEGDYDWCRKFKEKKTTVEGYEAQRSAFNPYPPTEYPPPL